MDAQNTSRWCRWLSVLSLFVFWCGQAIVSRVSHEAFDRGSRSANWPRAEMWRSVRPNRSLNKIDFVSQTEGWGISSKGEIVYTQDGGRTWVIKRSPQIYKLFGNFEARDEAQQIQFFSAVDGWALEGGHLIHTNDGGSSWHKVSFEDVIIRSFYFFDQRTGWAVGERRVFDDEDKKWQGCLYATEDGGKSWKEVRLGVDLDYDWALFGVWASSKKNIWVVGDLVLHSEDAGRTWRELKLGGKVYGVTTAVRFIDENHGWITTNQGDRFYLTEDGGISWQVRMFPEIKGGIYALIQTGASTLWAVGQAGAYRSEDGGTGWAKILTGPFWTGQYLAKEGLLIFAGEQIVFGKL